MVALAFAAYVVMPIDVIPEPVPFVGIADDLLAFPLAYAIVSRMLPRQLMDVALRRARAGGAGERLWRFFLVALGLISIVWLIAFVGLGISIWRALS